MRPLLPSEAGQPTVRLDVNERERVLAMTHMRRDYAFAVDSVFGQEAEQEE